MFGNKTVEFSLTANLFKILSVLNWHGKICKDLHNFKNISHTDDSCWIKICFLLYLLLIGSSIHSVKFWE